MALVIRMRQQGAASRQAFRIVVTDIRNPRDGKYLEMLGWYNPFSSEEKNFLVDLPRLQYWVGFGAQMSDRVRTFVGKVAPEMLRDLHAKKQARLAKKRAKKKA